MNKQTLPSLALCSLMLAATIALPLIGCKTVTNPDGTTANVPDIERIALVAKEAATMGTEEALKVHPEWLPRFQLARGELVGLAAGPTITAAQLLDVLARLPVKELQSNAARLSIQSARIVIAGAGWSVVPEERLKQIAPVALAIAQGIELGSADWSLRTTPEDVIVIDAADTPTP